MKVVLASLLMLLTGAAAASSSSHAKIVTHQRRRRRLNKRALLQSAVAVDKHGNRRFLNDNNAFEITGAYSILFNQCISLSTQPQDEDVMFGDDMIGYTQEGSLISQTSFVLFNVCQTENCAYADVDEGLYMVTLAQYMAAMVEYMPNQKQEYCKACQEAQDWCLYDRYGNNGEDAAEEDNAGEEQDAEGEENEEEGEQQEEGNNEEGEGEQEQEGEQQEGEQEEGEQEGEGEGEGEDRRLRRRLNNNNNGYVEYVDCDTCATMSCFEEENDANNADNQDAVDYEDEDAIADWVNDMLECVQTDQYWGNYQLYAGFICNGYGTGAEIGLFLDEECSIYTTKKSYKSIAYGTDNYQYAVNSATVVTYPFVNTLDCKLVEYDIPYDAQEHDDDAANAEEQEANENDQDADGVVDACEELFKDDAMDLATCNNYVAADDAAEEEEQAQDENANNYDWISYQLTQEEADDAQATCMVVKALEGEYSQAHVYQDKDEEGNDGHIYDYNAGKQSSNGGGGKAGKVIGIVLLVVVLVVGAAMAMSMGMNAKKKDSKKQPLVSGKGALA